MNTGSMEDYCVRDVEICHRIYSSLFGPSDNVHRYPGLSLEQRFQEILNGMSSMGFAFDLSNAVAKDYVIDRYKAELAPKL